MKLRPIAVVMGSYSDWKVMKAATQVLALAGVPFEKHVISAHRTPKAMLVFAEKAAESYSLIIAGAGGSAHLPGMLASLTTLPVIGVPVELKKLSGLDSLLSIVQMPKGIPVATVAIDNAHNAGLLALRILSVSEPQIRTYLRKLQKNMIIDVKKMNRQLKA
jgi:5-(carboxyamino)imidazole ribonucleotide mutase